MNEPSAAGPGSPQATPLGVRLRRLWAGALLPPLAWLADFLIRYLSIRFANVHDQKWPMMVSTAGALLLLLGGARLSWIARRSARPDEKRLAWWGLGLALFFFVLILGQALPMLILNPREIA